jgi:signal transduction histidine kinase
VKVTAGVTRDGVVAIAVRDDGRGLDAAERAKALGRFWRSPRHQNVPGTGLGLAICADLVGAAGGELRLEEGLHRRDGSGHGFAAVVVLPIAPRPEISASDPETMPSHPDGAGSRQ